MLRILFPHLAFLYWLNYFDLYSVTFFSLANLKKHIFFPPNLLPLCICLILFYSIKLLYEQQLPSSCLIKAAFKCAKSPKTSRAPTSHCICCRSPVWAAFLGVCCAVPVTSSCAWRSCRTRDRAARWAPAAPVRTGSSAPWPPGSRHTAVCCWRSRRLNPWKCRPQSHEIMQKETLTISSPP